MKRQKPITAVILSFILIVSAILGRFPANTKVKAETEGYGISNPVIKDGVTTWDRIWFGSYWQSDEETKEPIKWRVLSVDGDDAFLLADKNLDCQPYNTEFKSVTWETCSLRTWLNSTFYQNAFSGAEQAAIRTTAVVNEDNPYRGTEGGNNTQDKVYLLSIDEASNAAYGFSSGLYEVNEARCAKNTEYAKKQGAYTNISEIDAGTGHWWLRSPGYNDCRAANVNVNGWADSSGGYAEYVNYAVRPALHINLSSTVWKKADKVNSLGDVIEAEGDVIEEETPYGISNPVIKDGVIIWDCIWFGNYWQSDGETEEPIKWRVLSVDGDDAFLLADKNLDCQPYNTEFKSVTWETCSLRTWLNSTFYQNAFSGAEQAAIRTTAVVNENNPYRGTKGGNNTQDKVYLLSIAEASNVAYGFKSRFGQNSETRCAKNTEYAKKQGAYTNISEIDAGNGFWWLRSPGYNDCRAAAVNVNGWGYDNGNDVNYDNHAVRPALHINLSSTAWKKAGKVNSLGDVIEAETPTSPSPETARPTQISTATPTPTISQTSAPTSTAVSVLEDLPAKYGIRNPVIEDGVTTWDCIWFGNYWQSNETEKEPIKWRVLSVDGDDAFLLADKSLDCQPYNTEFTSVTWETCSLRTWLNSTFYQNAFSGAEQAAIRTTAVVNEDNPYYGTKGGNNTQDKVYLLSIAEASNAAYGFDSMFNRASETRLAKNTEYAKKQGAYTDTRDGCAGIWWLRSPGSYSDAAAYVRESYGYFNGNRVYFDDQAVRPALHINLSSTAWKKAGKVNSLGDIMEAETPTSPSPETAKPTPRQTVRPPQIPTATPIQKPTLTPAVTPTPHVIGTPAPTPDVSSTAYGISNPVIKDETTTWDCIWFGNYWQSDEKPKEPIKWRVLSVDGDDAFLLADKSLDCQPYNTEHKLVTWETCSLRRWLNSTFYQNAFSEAEQAAVRITAIVNEDNPSYRTEGGNNTQDKVYLLSIAEASNAAYGFDSMFKRVSETRHAKNTEYAKKQGAYTDTSDSYAGNGFWWLRSPGNYSYYAADVVRNGWGDYCGYDVDNSNVAVRPALHINLSSTVWKKAGKVNSLGDIMEAETPTSPSPETAKPTQRPTPTIMQTSAPTFTATPVPEDFSTKYGINNPEIKDGVTTWDCIWFGNYWQSDEKTKEPIKWRVLFADGDDAFLLADKGLDCQPYNTEIKSVTWESCSLRSWLNSIFYKNAFSGEEQAAVRTTAVVNEDNPAYGTEGGNNTQDKVYLLSIAEASNVAYGFNSTFVRGSGTRCAKNTEYAKKQGAYTDTSDGYAGNGDWWLRSTGTYSIHATYVIPYGCGAYLGYVSNDNYAVRPALHINLSSSVWKKAGKVNSLGDIIEAETPVSPSSETAKPIPTLIPEEETSSDAEPRAVKSAPVKTILKDSTGTTYTVTSSGSSKSEVAYTAPKNKKVTSVAIPDAVQLNGTTYKVTSIKANAFKKCKKLKKVTIGKNINAIGKNAFYQCTKLKSITIKTTKLANKSIGNKAFAKLNKKVKIKVPKKKLSAYKKLLKKKGVTGKKQVIKK